MSYDSIDAGAEGRTIEGGATLAHEQRWHGGGGLGAVARERLVVAAGLSLSRRSPKEGAAPFRAAAVCGGLPENAGGSRPKTPGACRGFKADDERGDASGGDGISRVRRRKWLSDDKSATFDSNSRSIAWSPSSLSKFTKFSFSDQVRVVRAGADMTGGEDENCCDLRQGVVGQAILPRRG